MTLSKRQKLLCRSPPAVPSTKSCCSHLPRSPLPPTHSPTHDIAIVVRTPLISLIMHTIVFLTCSFRIVQPRTVLKSVDLWLRTPASSCHPVVSLEYPLLLQADGLLRRILGNTDTAADNDMDVTRQPRWRKVEALAKSFLGNTLHMLGTFPTCRVVALLQSVFFLSSCLISLKVCPDSFCIRLLNRSWHLTDSAVSQLLSGV